MPKKNTSKILKVCHDRILPMEMSRRQSTVRARGGGNVLRAVFEFRKMWINGSKLRVKFMGGSAAKQAIAKEQAKWWSQHANLTFEFIDVPDAEIRIAFDTNDGAWSYIGTDCRKIPQGEPTMNLGFLDGGTAGHEFGHAIGLGHEHQNPDGGIEWNEETVIRDLGGPPNSWTPDQVRHNVLEKYKANQIRGTKFDPDSIMLYFFPGNWTKSGKGTKANESLSSTDKAFISSDQAYPRTSIDAVELKINASSATSAKIGAPGEEDLFTFNVKTGGRHTVATSGNTDVYMKLFGPTSSTNLIAEDDDSGVGTNARIIADLIPGQYFAQIRHFNKASGTGSYKIGVTK
ncbi:MAG TPA: M12 family metallopeptidase [Pyrinomonadaceae bacterium]|nr:M12 family metallopeptidase [Pyrinomonadaceae bacterium]